MQKIRTGLIRSVPAVIHHIVLVKVCVCSLRHTVRMQIKFLCTGFRGEAKVAPLVDMNSICFDTETTGLHPNGSDPDEILTISIIGRDGSVLLDERFRPTVKTEWPHASAVNGIYPEDVADLPTIETAIPRLREIFAGADEVIGYNVGFDLGFLSAVGVRPREDARITDTMKEFTWFMGRRYKLVDAADHIGYEWTGRAHGSLADALATLAVQR